MPAQVAALVNGAAGHSYEFDDTHNASMSHPGAVIVPAVLAQAAGAGLAADRVLMAIIVGYEAMTRIGLAANANAVLSRGFHPTSLFGAFGAAAAVGVVRGFDAATLVRAWGHALSLAGGAMQFSDEAVGTDVKRLHAGYGAQNGVLAAGMAAAGIGAPARGLDGKYGLLALYGRDTDPQWLQPRGSQPLQIHDVSLKPYSCCRLFHSIIDALEEATDGFTLAAEQVERVHIRGPEVLFDQHMLRRPRAAMAAQYSLPYVVGTALAYGSNRIDVYQPPFFDDPRILRIADRVDGERDLAIEAHYPAQMGGAVELHLRDGGRRESLVMHSRGSPARPLSEDQIIAKGQGLWDAAKLGADTRAARDAVWNATQGDTLVELFGG